MKDHTRDYCTAALVYAYSGGPKRYIDDLVQDFKRQRAWGSQPD